MANEPPSEAYMAKLQGVHCIVCVRWKKVGAAILYTVIPVANMYIIGLPVTKFGKNRLYAPIQNIGALSPFGSLEENRPSP